MKIIKIAFIFVVLFFIFSIPTLAASDEPEDFWEDFESALPEGSVDLDGPEDILGQVGVEEIIDRLLLSFSESGAGALSLFLALIGIGALLILAELNVFSAEEGVSRNVSVGVSVISALIIFSRLGSTVSLVGESLSQLSSFFSSVIPIFSGILLASGNPSSATVQSVNMSISLGAVSVLATNFLLPLCFSLFALSLLSGIGDGGASSLARGIRSLFNWGLGISTTVILGASSMQSVIASASDSAYLKAAKYAASGMIPVVGGAVSGALGTLAGGLSYIKSSVGIAAVMVVVGIILSPLISLLLYRISFSVCISFLEFMDCKGGVRLFSAFRSAYDALIAVYAVSGVIYIIQIVIFINGGASVFG